MGAACGAASPPRLPLSSLRQPDDTKLVASDSLLDALPSESFGGMAVQALHQGATVCVSKLMRNVLGR